MSSLSGSLEILRSYSLDRSDLSFHELTNYPESYQNLKENIENIFSKSELLLKSKLQFEQLVKYAIPEAAMESSNTDKEVNLNLVVTGAVKAGKSSLINILLNAKILPPGIIGTNKCVELVHPKNELKQISIGVHEWSGWEIKKFTDVPLDDVSDKIAEIQKSMIFETNNNENGKILNKRIRIQLPHWFLKNTNIIKCGSIDGLQTFDEPFDIIENNANSILIYIIDASNGIIEPDRTFLSKVKYKKPDIPIFFVINRIDIQQEADLFPKFEISMSSCCGPEMSTKLDTSIDSKLLNCSRTLTVVDSGSDCTSTDDTAGVLNEDDIEKKQNSLINNTYDQIMKLGFALDIGTSISFGCFSVKEYNNYLTKISYCSNFMKNICNEFFIKICAFLERWYQNLLITNVLKLKSRVNAVVDSIFCEMTQANQQDADITAILFFNKISEKERSITEHFNEANTSIEKQLQRFIKDEIGEHKNKISPPLNQIKSEDVSKVFNMMRPFLKKSIEEIFFGNNICNSKSNRKNFNNGNSYSQYGHQCTHTINLKINEIISKCISKLQENIKSHCKSRSITLFSSSYGADIYNLFETLLTTLPYPHVTSIPDSLFSAESHRIQEMMKQAKRKLLRTNLQPIDIVQQAINSINVQPLIHSTLTSLQNILQMLQQFSKVYQDTYKMAKRQSLMKSELLNDLILCDLLLEIIERSFVKTDEELTLNDFIKKTTFSSDFYVKKNESKEMYQIVNSNSFSAMKPFCDSLWLRRMCKSKGSKHILYPKKIELLKNGFCLFTYYLQMDYSLLTRLKMRPEWTGYQIGNIAYQLAKSAKYLSQFQNVFYIRFYPTNIYLKASSEMFYCMYHPYMHVQVEHLRDDKTDPYKSYTPVQQIALVILSMLLNDPTCYEQLPQFEYNNNSSLSDLKEEPDKMSKIRDKVIKMNGGSQLDTHISPGKVEPIKAELINLYERILFNGYTMNTDTQNLVHYSSTITLDGLIKDLEKYRRLSRSSSKYF